MSPRIAASLLVALAAAGCGSGGAAEAPKLSVAAASSLGEVLPVLDDRPRYQFAASDTLATQIAEGADVDVFVSADIALLDRLHAGGVVDRPVEFAVGRVVLVVPESSGIASIDELERDASAILVMARPGVPLGDYTIRVLDALGRSGLAARARSLEPDARSVTSKVALGEADAGFVYATDARLLADELRVIELPRSDANRAPYGVAVVSSSTRTRDARAFVDRLASAPGQAALRDAGFDLPR